MEALLAAAAQLGVGGLFGFMWWQERKDRLAAETERQEKERRLSSTEADRAALLEVVKENTEAVTALKAEVHRWHTRSIARDREAG